MSMTQFIRHAIAVMLLTGVAACSDENGPTGVDPTGAASFASEPVSHAGFAQVARAGMSANALSATNVVYVSLPSGTVPSAALAVIKNAASGLSLTRPMVNGGLDPVAVAAKVGDRIEVMVSGDGNVMLRTADVMVPPSSKPRIIRTIPPRRKTDVPLNPRIITVFSEPIRPSSAASIRLLRGGAAVSGTVVLSADGLRAELQLNQLLAPNTDYVLSVSSDVVDLQGDALEEAVAVEFSTGSTVTVASIATDEAGLILNPFTDQLRTFEMNAVLDESGQFSGSFSIFYADKGWRVSGRVTCFAIVQGQAAWVAGIIEEHSNPEGVGVSSGWRVEDNGAPDRGVADRLSLAHDLLGDGSAAAGQDFCATTPIIDPSGEEVVQYGLLSGNIVVRGETPPLVAPPFLPGRPALAFAAHVNDNTDIYVTKPIGGVTRLTVDPAADLEPSWSPDRTGIAFRSERDGNAEIYVMNANGTAPTRLTTDASADYHPAWSTDGSRIAFVSERDGNAEIYVMSANGSNVARLTTNAAPDRSPSWSPDGGKIAFSSERDGSSEIYVMNADGSNVLRLTNDVFEDIDPAWSPDGTKIAFSRFVQAGCTPFSQIDDGGDVNFTDYGVMCRRDIMVMKADGSGAIRLDLPTAPGVPGGWWRSVFEAKDPTWSPDGTRIAVAVFYCLSDFGGADCHSRQSIVLLSASGTGGFVELTTGIVSADYRFWPIEFSPAWKP